MLRRFPDLEDLAGAFASVPIVVDGEICSLDAKGRSSFQRLQEAMRKPVGLTYVAFDLLYADGADLRSKPLEERKALLERMIRDDGLVLYSGHVLEKGKALFASARKSKLEGIIGKRRSFDLSGAAQPRLGEDQDRIRARVRGRWLDRTQG